jgi:hypothetical protein
MQFLNFLIVWYNSFTQNANIPLFFVLAQVLSLIKAEVGQKP